MLRNALLGLGGSLIAAGIVVLIAGNTPPAMVCLVWGAILVFGIVYERYAYKTIVDRVPAGKDWSRTTERFIDEKTGKTVTVYIKPLTGERAYVAEPEGQMPRS
ncbi:MAG: hypothetical protein KGJ78_02445 [Alphaproteobacteria bacterium]|nr:hypothetical protein [Alphaproteobacteria bacterium]